MILINIMCPNMSMYKFFITIQNVYYFKIIIRGGSLKEIK